MVVNDDDIETGVGGRRQGLMGRGAAIDGDDHRSAALLELQQRLDIRSVAFLEAVGNIGRRAAADGDEETRQQRRRCRPVDVVIAEDADRVAVHDCPGQAFGGGVHVFQTAGIGQQVLKGRIEENIGLFQPDAARRQHPADDFRHRKPLRHGQGLTLIGLAAYPALAGQ